jgi:catechol 2,3-dioxygenase-like lactoylglutathione lyase family enzyme
MNRLEHVNLVVKDIQPSLEFILTAFPNWIIRGEGQGERAGQPRNWLHVGDDDYYLTLNDGAQGAARDHNGTTPGLAHLGFVVEDLEALMTRLNAKGYNIDIIGRDHPHRKSVYYIDPNGFQFEFMEYLSEEPKLKNQYGGESGDLIKNERAHVKVDEKTNAENFIRQLYREVDAKNIDFLAESLNSEVNFRIGENPMLTDKESVLIANKGFFASIHSMKHQLDAIWVDGNQVGGYGQVDYVRLDGSEHSAKFSTALTIINNKIKDYFVFADLSQL